MRYLEKRVTSKGTISVNLFDESLGLKNYTFALAQ